MLLYLKKIIFFIKDYHVVKGFYNKHIKNGMKQISLISVARIVLCCYFIAYSYTRVYIFLLCYKKGKKPRRKMTKNLHNLKPKTLFTTLECITISLRYWNQTFFCSYLFYWLQFFRYSCFLKCHALFSNLKRGKYCQPKARQREAKI